MERIPLDAISPDATFRLREPSGVPELASAIGRLGQLDPVDVRPLPPGDGAGVPAGPRFQLLTGFRRVEALRLLQRDTALARVHPGLSDQDAWAVALAGPLFTESWSPADLDAIAPTLRARFPWAEPALARQRAAGGKGARPEKAGKGDAAPGAEMSPKAATAVAPSRQPAADPAAFAHGLAVRASALNEEVAAAWDRWESIPPAGRKMILEQIRYLARVLPLLERESP